MMGLGDIFSPMPKTPSSLEEQRAPNRLEQSSPAARSQLHTSTSNFDLGAASPFFPTGNDSRTPPRSRSDSWTHSMASPFGPGLFSSPNRIWDPIGRSTSASPFAGLLTPPGSDASMIQEDDTIVVARTLDYLGLGDDDFNPKPPLPPQQSPSNRAQSTFLNSGLGMDPLGAFSAPVKPAVATMSSALVNQSKLDAEFVESDEVSEDEYSSTASEDNVQEDSRNPTRSLWIGNIDPTVAPADLLALFSPFGTVESLRILPDKECAFVNYVDVQDAIRAKEEMQGGRVGNCIIRVGFGKAEGVAEFQGGQPTKSLWVGNIASETTSSELESVFSAFGSVESARVLSHKNCGFVNFHSVEDAIKSKRALNGKDIHGSAVRIGFAKAPSKMDLKAETATPPRIITQATVTQAPMTPLSLPVAPTVVKTPPLQSAAKSSEALFAPSPKPLGTPHSLLASVVAHGHKVDGILDTEPMAPATANSTNADKYASSIPPVPDPNPTRKVDQNRLREMRKRLEGHATVKDVDAFYHEIMGDVVDLCSDYIGNVIIQKIIEKSNDHHRLKIIEKIAPHMAAIGIHKNGTWAVQKIIDTAKTTTQIQQIVNALKYYTPPLLLDQFGNYVVQCCLRLGTHRNQFVFDAMHDACVEIGTGRFGARSMRACLESQYTTKRQQKHVAVAIVHNAVQLITNPNGTILLTWLLDTSALPGRFRVLAPKLIPKLQEFCTHKLASTVVLKVVNQRTEMDARDLLLKEIFFRPDNSMLESILSNHVYGVATIHKILVSPTVMPDEKIALADRIRLALRHMPEVKEHQGAYKRILDELNQIPTGIPAASMEDSLLNQDIVSPLTTQSPFPLPHASQGDRVMNGFHPVNPMMMHYGYMPDPQAHMGTLGMMTAESMQRRPATRYPQDSVAPRWLDQ